MRAYAGYALVAAGVLGVLAGLLGWLLGPDAARSIWWAAAIAYVGQLVAFGALLRYRRGGTAFMGAWAGGMLVRLLMVLLAAFWVTRSEVLEPAPALLGLAGFLFVLVLLEPVFLFVGRREG